MSNGATISAALGDVPGVTAAGGTVEAASFQYEVCFRCHADENVARASYVPRRITQVNTRLEFAPNAVSSHPIVGPGRNPDVPSLRPGWTEGDVMSCGDCHGSDTSRKAGGTGPNGIHGSNEPPLLLARYETGSFVPESSSSYALCYRCHERDGPTGILGDRSFPHRVHVSMNQIACSTCHDPHGISSAQGSRRNNSHLINFDTSVVFPHPTNGRMMFEDTGTFAGSCTLSCHGVVHSGLSYQR
jgi:cytochrome c553